jgi:hypothetical protein
MLCKEMLSSTYLMMVRTGTGLAVADALGRAEMVRLTALAPLLIQVYSTTGWLHSPLATTLAPGVGSTMQLGKAGYGGLVLEGLLALALAESW